MRSGTTQVLEEARSRLVAEMDLERVRPPVEVTKVSMPELVAVSIAVSKEANRR